MFEAHLTLMSLEHEVLRDIELTDLIDKFAKIKTRNFRKMLPSTV